MDPHDHNDGYSLNPGHPLKKRNCSSLFSHRGDSASNWRLLAVLKGEAYWTLVPDANLANLELVRLFFSEGSPLASEDWEDRLFMEGAPVQAVPSSPADRLLAPEEKCAVRAAFELVLESGAFTTGPQIAELEAKLRDFLGRRHVILTSSGTDALLVALLAMGIGKGDEVIMPANSFAATENAVVATGATPVLADITPTSYTLDPISVVRSLSPKTRVLLPVHLFGRLADMRSLRRVAEKYGLEMIEDGCQSIGASGLGQLSSAAVVSFNPQKNFGVCGKGGAILTDNDELAFRCRSFCYHGFHPDRKHVKAEAFGLNARMDNVQAAVALARLPFLSLLNFKRLVLAMRYRALLAPLEAADRLVLPRAVPEHAWHQFTIEVSASIRDLLRARLKAAYGVETAVMYPLLSHQQRTRITKVSPCFGDLAVTERVHQRMLQLPLFPAMTLGEQRHITEAITSELRSAA